MIIRDESKSIDTLLCGVQGYLGAMLVNAIKTPPVIAPLNSAILTAGTVFLERIIYPYCNAVLPKSFSKLDHSLSFSIPIPKVVSYTLSGLSVLKVMHIVQLIPVIPYFLSIAGTISLVVLALFALKEVASSIRSHSYVKIN